MLISCEAGRLPAIVDEEHLEYATAQGHVLYSFNVGDYYPFHTDYLAQGRSHVGIILARQHLDSVDEQTRRLVKLTGVKSSENMKYQVESLFTWG